jgi:SAM-dependent methyltransferase
VNDSQPAPPRLLFGEDPTGYATGRPGYPAALFDALEERCGLTRGTPTLEIGPGTGQATAELLSRGARPLVLVEPDPRLAAFLRERFGAAIEVRVDRLESVPLDEEGFRLVVSASAFHWIDQRAGVTQVARAVTPGGWWAAWWTTYEDDELSAALEPIMELLPPVAGRVAATAFALDRETRLADLRGSGAFESVTIESFPWTLPLDGPRARALYRTFSPVLALDMMARDVLLDRIASVLQDQFGGRFDRRCATVLYAARRV